MELGKIRPTQAVVRTFLVSLAAALLAGAAGAASASPVAYSFATAAGPYGGSAGPIGLFASDATAFGSFDYDADAAPTGTAGNGATRYSGSLFDLYGTADGHVFSDPSGYTLVGNDVLTSGQYVDFLQLTYDPPPGIPGGTYNLVGFNVGDYTLVNVRMFWIEGQNGITDFLDDQSLPAVLPAFPGVLALDFVDASGTPSQSEFFGGLSVSPVPEPRTAAMLLAGLGMLAFVGWVRKSRSGFA